MAEIQFLEHLQQSAVAVAAIIQITMVMQEDPVEVAQGQVLDKIKHKPAADSRDKDILEE